MANYSFVLSGTTALGNGIGGGGGMVAGAKGVHRIGPRDSPPAR